jgi:hypothetical protein
VTYFGSVKQSFATGTQCVTTYGNAQLNTPADIGSAEFAKDKWN